MTGFVGSLEYCSEEMKACYKDHSKRFVDLYSNDLCCLNSAVHTIEESLKHYVKFIDFLMPVQPQQKSDNT